MTGSSSPRLRDRQARARGRGESRHRHRDPLPHRHEPRHDAGHGRLHVARAGPRAAGRPPLGPLLVRRRALRDADGPTGVQGHDRRRHAERDPARGPDGSVGRRTGIPPGCCASCAAASRRAPTTASRPLATWPSPSRAPRPTRVPRRLRAVTRRNAPPAPRVPLGRRRAAGGGGRSACGSVAASRRPGLRRPSRS